MGQGRHTLRSIYRLGEEGGRASAVNLRRLLRLACILRTMTKKGRQLFVEKKSAPPGRENPVYAHVNRTLDSDLPDEHLEYENAECPPVDGLVVAFVLDYLGRQVFRSTAQRPRSDKHVDQKT